MKRGAMVRTRLKKTFRGLKPHRLMGLFALIIMAASGLRSQGPAPTKIRLALQWNHQSQFAGYYVALDKGYYAARGLDVTILEGGPDKNPIEELRSGTADVATQFLTGALTAMNGGTPLVNLAQVVNRSNLTIVAWKDRQVKRIEDLEGRRVSLWGEQFNAPYLALFKARRVQPAIVPQFYSVELFLRRGVEACSAMQYSEVHRIFQAGVDADEVTVFSMQDLGFGFPEDGLYCLPSFAARSPAAGQAFAEASMEGWKTAGRTPEEALAMVMKRTRASHIPANQAHMRWMLTTILKSIFPEAKGAWKPGELSREDYARTVSLLLERGLIKAAPSYEVFAGKDLARVP
jgi:NitT/TauT family transport system substrate-binding protein